MEMLMLTGAIITALGGMLALAFRVVRPPLGQRRTQRPATITQRLAPDAAREPAQLLVEHLRHERKRHADALREARALQRSRNAAEALTKLLDERVYQARAARALGRFADPALGGRFRQWYEQARRDLMVEVVAREVEELRFPGHVTQPLTSDGAWSRLVTWVRGGPATGAPADLAAFHRAELKHYRFELRKACRIERGNRRADALTSLAAEYRHHRRNSDNLKLMLQALAGDNGADEATEPSLTAILN